MKTYITLFLTLFMWTSVFCGNKYALIIAIGDYPGESGWGKISSAKDVELIKNALINKGFNETNISIILDAKATKAGMEAALNALLSKAQKGDIVAIHYSGHGQQIFDDNGDEPDGWDEALVPYNAAVQYDFKGNGYKGENHFRDDELGDYISKFRNKLGNSGQLLLILDSCHSGSSTRGPGAIVRGGGGEFAPPNYNPNKSDATPGGGFVERVKVNQDAAPFVVFTGASQDELNYEYQGYGSLSYALSQAMNELDKDETFRQLFSKVAVIMAGIAPRQKPTVEGNIDYTVFGGDYKEPSPYYEVTEVDYDNTGIKINGGQINRIFNETTVSVLPINTLKMEKSKILATGKVTSSKLNEADIKLDKALPTDNPKAYKVFIEKPAYGNISVNVFLDKGVTDAKVIAGVKNFLQENHLGKVVNDYNQSDVSVFKEGTDYDLTYSRGNKAFADTKKSRGEDQTKAITDKIFTYAQGSYLKNFSIADKDFKFKFELIPVKVSEVNENGQNKKKVELVQQNRGADSGMITVVPKQDQVVLKITNESNQDLYISIVEINTAGEITPFFPNNKCKLNDEERKLAAGKTFTYLDCVYSFSPPYEQLVLKGFASDKPLNFQATATSRGEGSATHNPLEKFLQQTYTKTRGSDADNLSGDLQGFSFSLPYEIVEKKP